jgi:hypothetical protein
MRSKQKSFLLLGACVLFFGRQMLAEPEVTFEILASFDYPEALGTYPSGINESGVVVGSFINGSNQTQGFIRFPDGTFSDPIVYPGSQSTYPSDINNTGTMCGSYILNGAYHGFFLSGSTFTNFDLQTPNTLLRGVNDAGNFSGTTIDRAFVSIDGTLTMFDIPRQAIIDAYGINSSNQLVGGAVHGAEIEYSFRRDPDGKIVWPIQAPGFANTGMFGLDDKGRMVGFVTSLSGGPTEAVFLRPSHRFAVFSYPGAIFTEFYDINSSGKICGGYYSPDGKAHGFIARVRAAD